MRQYGSAKTVDTETEEVVNKNITKKEAKKTKFQKLLIKLKLDPHHRMERFAITSISLFIVISLLTAYAAKLYIDSKKITLTTQAIYTTSAVWSLTGGTVTVDSIYRNEDTSKVFILLKMSSDTMEKMPTDAKNYEMYVTGYDEKLTNNLVGSVYMFGNSGYMGLYFADSAGIDAHMYDIVVRNTNVVTTDRSKSAPSRYNDESFKYHNQIRIYANLAGSSAKVADFLNQEPMDVTQIYAQTVMATQEAEVKKQLNDTLIDMNNTMMLINEYRTRLVTAGINPDVVYDTSIKGDRPAIPELIANDSITTDVTLTEGNATQFVPSETSTNPTIVNNPYNITVQTEEGMDFTSYVQTNGDKDSQLYLVTKQVFPGGYQYNYQDLKLIDHFLPSMIPSGMNFRQWVQAKNAERDEYNASKTLTFGHWYWADGSGAFEYNSSDGYNETYRQIQRDIGLYEDAIQHLYMLKYDYQETLLYNYLVLASNMETTQGIFTVNAEKTALTMY